MNEYINESDKLKKYVNNDLNYDSCYVKQFLNNINEEVRVLYDQNNLNKQFSLTNISNYKKYKSINYILVVVIVLCLLVILLTMLNKSTSYFDDTSYIIIMSLLLAFGLVYIVKLYFDFTTRDNINFDEYSFSTNLEKPKTSNVNISKKSYYVSDISLCNI
jgi:hypothetical protein